MATLYLNLSQEGFRNNIPLDSDTVANYGQVWDYPTSDTAAMEPVQEGTKVNLCRGGKNRPSHFEKEYDRASCSHHNCSSLLER